MKICGEGKMIIPHLFHGEVRLKFPAEYVSLFTKKTGGGNIHTEWR